MINTCPYCEKSFSDDDNLYCLKQCWENDHYRHSNSALRRASISYIQYGVYPEQEQASENGQRQKKVNFHDYLLKTIQRRPSATPPLDVASQAFQGYQKQMERRNLEGG